MNGHDVGIYGFGWDKASGNTLYDFAAGEALYRNCAIAISDTFPGTAAFVSNRLFQALAAGAFVLQQHVPEIEAYTGLVPGEHFDEWVDADDLRAKIDYWMDGRRKNKRQGIANSGRDYVRTHFSFDAQLRKLFGELLPAIAPQEDEPEALEHVAV
jgi:spore maturation protein CgeB